MIVPILSALALGGGADAEASFVDATVRFDAEQLDWAFVDIDGDGADELAVAVRPSTGRRELRLFRMTAQSVDPKPYQTIEINDSIIAWTFADVRPELEGRELIFLTRSGAYSFDPRKTSYRDALEPLCDIDLLYDIPSPRALPYWTYVLATDSGEQLILPDRRGFKVFGPNPDAGEGDRPWHAVRSYRRTEGYAPPDPADRTRRRREEERRSDRQEARLRVTVGASAPRPFIETAETASLVDDDFRIQAPALVDIDGDGRRDMILLAGSQLQLFVATPSGLPAMPTRTEELPDYLEQDDRRASLRLVDIDGNGRLDVLGIWSEEVEGFENVQWRVYSMISTPNRMLPAKPTQVLLFKAAEIQAVVTDVDGDGRPDLAVRRFEVPSLLGTVTGLEFRYAHLLYLGQSGSAPFERSPAMRQEQTYDEDSVQEILRNRELVLDCSGDGIADLVEVDLKGRLGIRRLERSSGFFTGTKWSIDDGYWKQYESRGSVSSLHVMDLNGDGLGDIVSSAKESLAIYLSRRR